MYQSKKPAIIARVLMCAESLLGTDYSRTDRDNIYRGGAADCSSFIAACWGAAGFPLLSEEGAELRTSCYEVNARGFDLIYPAARAQVGKILPSADGLLSDYGAEPGDIVFMNFDSKTTRANRITHVAMIHDNGRIIHTANNREKCCYKPLTYGNRRICAIMRLRDDITLPALPEMSIPGDNEESPERWAVRALQVALNLFAGESLKIDGSYGTKTAQAVDHYNKSFGAAGGTCSKKTLKMLGFINNDAAARNLRLIDKPRMGGEDVRELQERLVQMGYDLGKYGIDGVYGTATDNAMRTLYDRAQRLTRGVVDDSARALLGLEGDVE